jgi:hypothetical protein
MLRVTLDYRVSVVAATVVTNEELPAAAIGRLETPRLT